MTLASALHGLFALIAFGSLGAISSLVLYVALGGNRQWLAVFAYVLALGCYLAALPVALIIAFSG